MDINVNPNTNGYGHASGTFPLNQMSNSTKPQPWYKLVKQVKGSEKVEVICKSHANMPPKLEILRLREEFKNLIEMGCLNAALEDLSGADFKLSCIKNGVAIEIYYELVMETEYTCVQYDAMI